MKGLIIKDLFTLTKQMRFFLLFVVVFCIVPNFNGSSFAIVYSSLLPITAVAYDEQSKWRQLALTMPYKKSDLVISKYVLGYILLAAVTAFAYICQTVICLLKGSGVTADTVVTILSSASGALVMLALVMPALFRFGVEKGRIVMLITIGVIVAFVMLLQEKLIPFFSSINFNSFIVTVILVIAIILLNIISIIISVRSNLRR